MVLGRSVNGQLVPPSLLTGITDLSLGQEHSCAVAAGQVRCWGGNVDGVINVPVGVTNATALASSFENQCALMADRMQCWGDNTNGQSGASYGTFTTLAVGGAYNHGHTCAGGPSGVQCSGANESGQRQPPPGLVNVTHLAASDTATCAIASGALVCWGSTLDRPPVTPANPLELRGNHGSFCVRGPEYLTCWGNQNLLFGRGLLLKR